MLPPAEDQPATVGVDLNPISEESEETISENSVKLLKTLDFEFTNSGVVEKRNESCEERSSELFISHKENFEELEEKSEKESVPFKLEINDSIMTPTTVPTNYDSNVTAASSSEEQEEVTSVLKELENKATPEPSEMSESIVRATFVDFSVSEEEDIQSPTGLVVQGEELNNTEELGKEFSLTLNPDLPRIRAQQIRNWLEFEKETETGMAKRDDEDHDDISGGEKERRKSREVSPAQDFELDSLTMMGGVDRSTIVPGLGDHTVTDADGLQRRVRFLTDPHGNILISVFLTNVDGEEEEQQQVIQLGDDNELPDGMNFFPEIESQLAAFVSHTQQNKPDLVDTDKILKELGVEKDTHLEDEAVDTQNVKQDNERPEGANNSGAEKGGRGGATRKTRVSAAPSLSVFDEGDDVGSDSETMSTSSCSSMIEVKPKKNEISTLREKPLVDENNNEEVIQNESSVDRDIAKVNKKENSESESGNDVQDSSEMDENNNLPTNLKNLKPNEEENNHSVAEKADNHEADLQQELRSKFCPTLVDVELKGSPTTPAFMQMPKHTTTTAVNNDDESHASPVMQNNDDNVVTLQVVNVESPPNGFYNDDAENQLESLCIEEEPISAVALTIAKWENFSRKQQQQAESGEKVSIAVKGLGKLILPMYPGGNYPNSAPIKMAGPTTPAKPMKQGQGHHNNNNNAHTQGNDRNGNQNNGTTHNNKLWNGCGWGSGNSTNGTNNNTTNKNPFLDRVPVEYEEESIYEKPNSQAGCLSITTSSSNPSTLLKSYPKPNSRGEIVNWFKEGELYRSGILLSYAPTTHHTSPHIVAQPVPSPIVVSWFFGLITRSQAEELLLGQPTGTFLVRISTRVWGYTLSYQSNNKTKHFLISAINPAIAATLMVGPGNDSDQKNGPTGKQQLLFPFSPGGKYAFIGTNMNPYTTLTSLIRHHSHAPITKAGGEKLLTPCPGGPRIHGLEYVFK